MKSHQWLTKVLSFTMGWGGRGGRTIILVLKINHYDFVGSPDPNQNLFMERYGVNQENHLLQHQHSHL